jgi:hypothetical protein
VSPPSPPSRPSITYTPENIILTWEAPPGARIAVQEPASGELLKAAPLGFAPSVPSAYNVYPQPPETSTDHSASELTAPLNPAPVAKTTFEDPKIEWGVERCYTVRTLDQLGGLQIESAASPVACVTPVDTFAPAAPKSLAAVASAGAVSLIWESNTEKDLAGYVVLRGETPGEKLQPITPAPIRETTFRDETVKPGVRYVYAVVAVDTAKPPNVSAESNRVEETAR